MKKEKVLIFDSSTIISLALNNLLYILKNLKESFNGKFLITEDVRKEIIDRPLQIKRFELESLGIRQLVEDKILEMPAAIGISDGDVHAETMKMMDTANRTFNAGEWMRIINYGEASCFALSRLADKKGLENALAIDERTARMLSEKPENLHELYERKLHMKVYANPDNFSYFEGFRIIRSAELCYVAYKKGIIEIRDRERLLDALLYAMKFKGCAISIQEIEAVKRL